MSEEQLPKGYENGDTCNDCGANAKNGLPLCTDCIWGWEPSWSQG